MSDVNRGNRRVGATVSSVQWAVSAYPWGEGKFSHARMYMGKHGAWTAHPTISGPSEREACHTARWLRRKGAVDGMCKGWIEVTDPKGATVVRETTDEEAKMIYQTLNVQIIESRTWRVTGMAWDFLED